MIFSKFKWGGEGERETYMVQCGTTKAKQKKAPQIITVINKNNFVFFTDENTQVVVPHVHDVGGKLLKPVLQQWFNWPNRPVMTG